jgi:hydrogenase nickel incorporation protein HypB
MCTVCGCSGDGARIEGARTDGAHRHEHTHNHAHTHRHADGAEHSHDHDHHHAHRHDHAGGEGHGHGDHDHPHDHDADTHHDHHHGHGHGHHQGNGHDHGHRSGDLHYGHGPARAHAPGLTQARMVEIETSILSKNDAFAARNRDRLAEAAVLALNLVSSPGSGKTTLLVRTVEALKGRFPVAVIEGDQQTANDAERIRATGVPALQINTGKGCHLDAHMVGHAMDHLGLPERGVLFVENVGNLVCPAAFDLGEAAKVAILSVTEGEDKPLKYPDMFTAARLVILNKTDLAPHCDVDLDACEANARRVNPQVEIIRLSARTGEGLDRWLGWIEARRAEVLDRATAAVEAKLQALRAAR